MKQKIALGTVQLGIPYGINNRNGKPDQHEAFSILDEAYSNKITLLDSAEAYGNSIEVIGAYLKTRPEAQFEIVSKFIGDNRPLHENVKKTLNTLNCTNLYAYLYHRFSDYKSMKYSEELSRLKKEHQIQKIGVSLYDLVELDAAVNDPEISIIQIPLNPFDCSEKKKQLLKQAKLKGKEIHVRSIFLQGLFFKKHHELTGNLQGFSQALERYHEVLKDYKLNVREACLNYAHHQPFVDYVLIGVETKEQLTQNIEAVKETFSEGIMAALESIQIADNLILNPGNWKP